MKVYFTGSLHNSDIDKSLYKNIVKFLEDKGYSVKSDHILNAKVVELDKKSATERSEYYQKLNKWMSASDIVVCEVSYPSTINIGHEVSLALDKGNPVVALYQQGRAPGVLQGINSDKFILLEYTPDTLESTLEYGIDEALSQADVRFNFFVSPKISAYLDWIAKKRRVPRAVYLRRLIEQDMEENEDYTG